MSDKDKVHSIEARCGEILRSPYVFKDLPEELHRLRTVMRNVEILIREEVPFLLTEVKKLRAENKRLTATLATAIAEIDSLPQQPELEPSLSSGQTLVDSYIKA